MLSVQDHCDVKCPRLGLRGSLAAQHREEVPGVREGRIRFDRRQLLPQSVVPRDDRRQLRDQRDPLPAVVLGVDRRLHRVGKREQRRCGAQHLHRAHVVGVPVDEGAGVGRQVALRELLFECLELFLGR